MRIVITGASGFLGLTLTLIGKQRAQEVFALCFDHAVSVPGVRCVKLDLKDQQTVDDFLQETRPDWLVHCAAATNVDWCEEHPDQARVFHVDVSRGLAVVARRLGVGLLYISTDSVFDGRRGGYVESDRCAPLNVYAATKLAGEVAVLEALPSALVVRTNMFGWKQIGAPTLAEWIVEELTAQRTVPGFADVIFTPLLVNDLSETLFDMMQRRLSGVYHVGGASACSKYDFARLVARAFGLREDLVSATVVHQADLRAPRPKNTALRSDKLVAVLGRQMPDVTEAVQRFRALYHSGFSTHLKQLRGELGYGKV